MIAAIIAAVAVSAAVDTRLVNPECRIIGQQVLGHQCCESCETDFVLHTRWVTRDAAAVAKVTDVDVGSGGGGWSRSSRCRPPRSRSRLAGSASPSTSASRATDTSTRGTAPALRGGGEVDEGPGQQTFFVTVRKSL